MLRNSETDYISLFLTRNIYFLLDTLIREGIIWRHREEEFSETFTGDQLSLGKYLYVRSFFNRFIGKTKTVTFIKVEKQTYNSNSF